MDEDGLVADLPGWVFVDWAKVNTKGMSTAVNAMAVDALQHAAKIARALGYPDRGGKWQIAAHDIREAVNDLLWEREQGVYIDGIVEGELCTTPSANRRIFYAPWSGSRIRSRQSACWGLWQCTRDATS